MLREVGGFNNDCKLKCNFFCGTLSPPQTNKSNNDIHKIAIEYDIPLGMFIVFFY